MRHSNGPLRHARIAGFLVVAMAACATNPSPPPESPSGPAPAASATATPRPSSASRDRVEGRGETPVLVGEPIPPELLTGRIVFDDFENVYTMNADGSGLLTVAGDEGAEFDGAWSPDGRQIVYRDSRRGINEDDEVYIVDSDGSGARNLTNNPANDWGPDWSPNGEWIAFNSDRDGGALSGYLVRPDGSDLRRIETNTWLEYPSFSPDGRQLVFEGAVGSDYEVWVADIATGSTVRLTDSRGGDGWPVWSPDGKTIAFTTERDDCARAPRDQDCWRTGEPGEHRDVWLMNPDGTDQRRVSPEHGQFVSWSPDGSLLLVSGHTLFVIRPDGTGRREIRAQGLPYPPGGIPDWTATDAD
jgi:Tol biopolymer transport system component